MNPKETTESTDRKETADAKDIKSSPVLDAFFIGFLVGIIIYSLMANSWGLLTLIPLFILYKLLKKSKKNKAS